MNSYTPFETHGPLRVNHTDLIDCHGNKVQLYGMSTMGLAWTPEYVNDETFRALRDEWHTNCIRLALYTDEMYGYCRNGNQEELKQLVKKGVDAACKLGMYVIVDWHVLRDETPLRFKEEAKLFFQEMSDCFRDVPNVLYEICNEPNGDCTWEEIKTYSEEIIPIIRSNHPGAVILVGTPNWSQDVDIAAKDPLKFDNIMYVLHFYAAELGEELRTRMVHSIEAGLPVFISEFGLTECSGDGTIDLEQGNLWREVIETYQLSFLSWSLTAMGPASSVFAHNCKKLSNWNGNDLSKSGKYLKAWFCEKAPSVPLLTINVHCEESYFVKGNSHEVSMIPFTCVSDGPLFYGKILGTGVDTQKKTSETFTLSARYMLEGEDYTGNSCRIFIENQGTTLENCKPSIVTDSKALSFLETTPLRSLVEPEKDGVTIQIYRQQ